MLGNISEQIIYKSVDKCTESNSVIPDMVVLKYLDTVSYCLYKRENSKPGNSYKDCKPN